MQRQKFPGLNEIMIVNPSNGGERNMQYYPTGEYFGQMPPAYPNGFGYYGQYPEEMGYYGAYPEEDMGCHCDRGQMGYYGLPPEEEMGYYGDYPLDEMGAYGDFAEDDDMGDYGDYPDEVMQGYEPGGEPAFNPRCNLGNQLAGYEREMMVDPGCATLQPAELSYPIAVPDIFKPYL